MPRLDYHLHEFRLGDLLGGNEVITGIPDSSFEDRITLPDYLVSIADYFSEQPVESLYDFGDDRAPREQVLQAPREGLVLRSLATKLCQLVILDLAYDQSDLRILIAALVIGIFEVGCDPHGPDSPPELLGEFAKTPRCRLCQPRLERFWS